ncbi:hypothetical protein D3C72_61300 [compost metagenome]
MERPLRQRVANMLLIKHLIRSGTLTREQASVAVQAGRGGEPGLPGVLLERGWVSPQRLDEALDALRITMSDLA